MSKREGSSSRHEPEASSCNFQPEIDKALFIHSFDRSQIRFDQSQIRSDPCPRCNPSTWKEAVDRLLNGNQKYARFIESCKTGQGLTCEEIPLSLQEIGYQTSGEPPPQLPFAAVLGCVDARAPVELLFSRSFDELYVMRIAGNSLGPECAGSLHYAIHSFAALESHGGHRQPNCRSEPEPLECPPVQEVVSDPPEKPLRLIIVLGHKDCGAVTAAVNIHLWECGYRVDEDAGEFLAADSVRGVLGRLDVPAVRLALKALPPDTFGTCKQNRKLHHKSVVELAVYLNAAWQAHDARTLLKTYAIEPDKKVVVRYGVFDLHDFLVRSIDGYHFTGDGSGTLAEPQSRKEFLGRPPKSLSRLSRLAECMAERLKTQAKTEEGRKQLLRHHRLL